jgi:hypothetical protein
MNKIIFTVILEWHLSLFSLQQYKTGYHTALNKQKPTPHDKLLMAPQIKHNWESIHPAPQYRFQTSLSE